MALWRLFYHFVWATNERRPLITPEIETLVHGYMLGKAHALGCTVHAIGGMPDHMHLVASVPPKLAVAEFVRNVKGAAAYHVNHSSQKMNMTFAWQRGYGVFSIGQARLDSVVTYVRNQKLHHRQGSLQPNLELMDDGDDGPEPWNQGEAIAHVRIMGTRNRDTYTE